MSEPNVRKKSLISRFTIRSASKSTTHLAELDDDRKGSDNRTRLRKGSLPAKAVLVTAEERRGSVDSARSLPNPRAQSLSQQAWELDKQTGERKDHTALLHSLVEQETFKPDYTITTAQIDNSLRRPGDITVSRLSRDLWNRVFEFANPADIASTAFTCKAFRDLLGQDPWKTLKNADNFREKTNFLVGLDESLPNHLLCFPCAIYHLRTQKGHETLRPTNISNPIFNCPNASNTSKKQSRIRLTFGRTLPFAFAQLALRAYRYSPDYGIPIDSLSKRYKDRPESNSTWSHQTRYAIMPDDHLNLRVVSTCFAPAALPPAGLRHLLYSREDFVPYFSVCPHWRDGELMPSVKCALSHIPKPIEGSGLDRVVQDLNYKFGPRKSSIVSLCSNCKPMRRCPVCPTEYLIEIKLMEDRSGENAKSITDPRSLFKQALVVTRWSDLGNGSTPWASSEWAACAGEEPDSGVEYDSFHLLGRRAISGEFEGLFNPEIIPAQRLVSLNPNNERLGEAGHRWY